MKNKYLALLLTILTSISLFGCNKDNKQSSSQTDEKEIDEGIHYDGHNLYYLSNSISTSNFLNDYTHRHMRYDDDSIGSPSVAGGTGFQKLWESMAVTFQNSSEQVYGEDKTAKIANYLFASSSQDDHGLIYNTPLTFESADSYAGDGVTYSIPQGWPFPSWQNSVSNFNDNGSLEAAHTAEFNFNESASPENQNWHATNGAFNIADDISDPLYGYGQFNSEGYLSSDTSFMFYRNKIDELLPVGAYDDEPCGIDTRYAPIVDMEIEYDGENIEDYNIVFKYSGDTEWRRASQKLYASTPNEKLNGHVHVRQFFDMYLNNEWNKKTIVELGIEFIGKDGLNYKVENGKINFLRPCYDTRQSNYTTQFILALYNHYIYTRDMRTLTKLMNKARKGLLFLTHALEGEKGLLSLEYLYGHDGVTPYSIKEKAYDRLAYHGLSNGYWDLTVSPMYNLEANTYFYQCLKAMAVLEDAMTHVDGDDKSSLFIKNRLPGGEDIYYDYDVNSLNNLANLVKRNMQKDIKVVEEENTTSYTAGDYHYQNKGGFYNPKTGRFALGINECTGDILDFGYTYFNLEAICADIGTEKQQKSIMEWIDGKRLVSSDTSTGEDIYFYEFAPRYNTLDCADGEVTAVGFYYQENLYNDEDYDEDFYTESFSREVQNGGAVIAWAYYDLLARSKVLGVENALDRLSAINNWYQKVLKDGGEGDQFYREYYSVVQSDATFEDYNNKQIYSVQGGGSGGGSLGLDSEFIENAIFVRTIPDAFFNMNANGYNNLEFTYNPDAGNKQFEIYNMKYGDALYSLRVRKGSIEVFNIKGIVNPNYQLTFKYKTSNLDLVVKVNGENYQNVVFSDGYVYVTVPFNNTKVRFG